MLQQLIRMLTPPDQLSILVREHFAGFSLEQLVSSARTFPARVRPDLQRAFDRIHPAQDEGVRAVGVHSPYGGQELSVASLWQSLMHGVTIGPLRYVEVDIGETDPVRCLDSTLWLLGNAGMPYAILIGPRMDMMGRSSIRIEVAAPVGEAGTATVDRYFESIEKAVAESSSYRGKVLSLELPTGYTGLETGILVHRLEPVQREELVLPGRTLELLERNVFQFLEHRKGLSRLGMSAKKGLLFHGPPGTGKTHTIHYLASLLKGHTVLLITAEQVTLLAEYLTLARLLQPSVVVLEDADLVAANRESITFPGQQALLNQLLNEMDGLREDAEILFILTTNRPDTLEPALASRPGRIDQAIEFPPPDDEGRRKLVALYGRELEVPEGIVEVLVRKTDGASAAFIKELMRRVAQAALERNLGDTVQLEDVETALKEMLFSGGRLSSSLLGGTPRDS